MGFLPSGNTKIHECYYAGRSVYIAESLEPDAYVQEFFCYGIIYECEEPRYLLQPIQGLFPPTVVPTHVHMWPTDKQCFPESWNEKDKQIYDNVLTFRQNNH